MISANMALEQPDGVDNASVRFGAISSIEEGRRMFRKVLETGVRYGKALEARKKIHSNVWNQELYGSYAIDNGIVETAPVVGR
jgi:hypothetical protein